MNRKFANNNDNHPLRGTGNSPKPQNTAFKKSLLDKLAANHSKNDVEIANQALDAISKYSLLSSAETADDLRQELIELARNMARLHPEQQNLSKTILQWQQQFMNTRGNSLLSIASEAQRIAQNLRQYSSQYSQPGLALIHGLVEKKGTVMLHGFSSCLTNLFNQLVDLELQIIITEAKPSNDAEQFFTKLDNNLDLHLISDAQIGLFVPKADLALLSPSCLLADGSAVGKSGSLSLALSCHYYQVPLYAFCQQSNFSDQLPSNLTLPTGDNSEISHLTGKNLKVHNYLADITPAKLIKNYIFYKGIFNSNDLFKFSSK